MPNNRARFILELCPRADDAKPLLRLRAALKSLWRAYRLQCISITEKATPAPDVPEPGAGRDRPS